MTKPIDEELALLVRRNMGLFDLRGAKKVFFAGVVLLAVAAVVAILLEINNKINYLPGESEDTPVEELLRNRIVVNKATTPDGGVVISMPDLEDLLCRARDNAEQIDKESLDDALSKILLSGNYEEIQVTVDGSAVGEGEPSVKEDAVNRVLEEQFINAINEVL